MQMRQFDQAAADFQRCVEMQPHSHQFRQMLQQAQRQAKVPWRLCLSLLVFSLSLALLSVSHSLSLSLERFFSFPPPPVVCLLPASVQIAKRKDYYAILSVSKTATRMEIKASFRELARVWHPDKHPVDKREEIEAKYRCVR